jgi:hypothetical protein
MCMVRRGDSGGSGGGSDHGDGELALKLTQNIVLNLFMMYQNKMSALLPPPFIWLMNSMVSRPDGLSSSGMNPDSSIGSHTKAVGSIATVRTNKKVMTYAAWCGVAWRGE